jgi:prolyl oligopeptidase
MTSDQHPAPDPYLWLEEVTGEPALDWARAHNVPTIAEFASSPEFAALEQRILDMLDTDARIAYPGRRGDWFYNFWRDAANPKGLWRRTTAADYRNDAPAWDVLVDVDALAEADGENWVWKSARVLRPDQHRALISLSRGGADAVVVREFDLRTRQFIDPVDGGFYLPEAKTQVSWIDDDTLYVGTDFGPGSLTDSGYPRIAKRWRRGTALTAAELVFEGEPDDVVIYAGYDRTPGFERHYLTRATDFFNEENYLLHPDGSRQLVQAPTDAGLSWYKNWLLVELKSPWLGYPAGALLAADFDAFLGGARDFEVLFAPDPHTGLHGYGWTENHLLLTLLTDVQTRLEVLTPAASGWTRQPLGDAPTMATTSVMGLDPLESGDEFMLSTSGFVTPATLLAGAVGQRLEPLKQEPGFFDTTDIGTEQYFATSADGTRVPYFVTRRAGVTGPAVLSGYGGFEVSRTPGYSGTVGMGWLERGGISVLANIRGGGEYGPEWHTSVQKANRYKCYEDFAAVADDLVARGLTTPGQLGAVGGSNGGLLVGVMLTRYPEKFGAIVCQVPLLDMRRYHLLLAGASWMAEYGDPDNPEDWAYLGKYSPYQNTDPDRAYPPILLTTSTRDDRVHPGHARKMTALLEAQGREVWYYENIEGGHGGAADNKQSAFQGALIYSFFRRKLMRQP